MSNAISEITRRNIFDELRLEKVNWAGRLAEDDFLTRVFDLRSLPSHDNRVQGLDGDLRMHRYNFSDWPDDWVYADGRLNLLWCADDTLLNFLCEMLHPLVRSDDGERDRLIAMYNRHLAPDSFEIAPYRYISGKPIYSGHRRTFGASDVSLSARQIADELGSTHVSAQLNRMEIAIQSDPPLAIGTAKEFVETMCKGILSKRGKILSGAEDIQRLVKLTREVLSIDNGDSNGATRKIVNGLATVTQGVAELRGSWGTGHGPHPEAAVAEPELARLTVGASIALGIFLLEVHRRSDPGAENLV